MVPIGDTHLGCVSRRPSLVTAAHHARPLRTKRRTTDVVASSGTSTHYVAPMSAFAPQWPWQASMVALRWQEWVSPCSPTDGCTVARPALIVVGVRARERLRARRRRANRRGHRRRPRRGVVVNLRSGAFGTPALSTAFPTPWRHNRVDVPIRSTVPAVPHAAVVDIRGHRPVVRHAPRRHNKCGCPYSPPGKRASAKFEMVSEVVAALQPSAQTAAALDPALRASGVQASSGA